MKGLRTKDSHGEWPHEIRLQETAEDVALLLLFLYKHTAGHCLMHELQMRGLDVAERLVKIAHRLNIQHLLNKLDDHLLKKKVFGSVVKDMSDKFSAYLFPCGIDIDDTFSWLFLADQYHLPKLTSQCHAFLDKHIKLVTREHDGRLEKLSSEFLTKIIEPACTAPLGLVRYGIGLFLSWVWSRAWM